MAYFWIHIWIFNDEECVLGSNVHYESIISLKFIHNFE
jgi:hypothetical protein